MGHYTKWDHFGILASGKKMITLGGGGLIYETDGDALRLA